MASSARIDELRKKFEENPRRYFAPLANEYRKAGDIEQAIAICREYLPQQPGHMSGHIVYGQALYEARQFDEAKAVFETALSLDPENLIALRHLGDIALIIGDSEGARGWYRRVLEADPRNEEIQAQLATLEQAAPTAAAATPPSSPSMPPPETATPVPKSTPSSAATVVISTVSSPQPPSVPVQGATRVEQPVDRPLETVTPESPTAEVRLETVSHQVEGAATAASAPSGVPLELESPVAGAASQAPPLDGFSLEGLETTSLATSAPAARAPSAPPPPSPLPELELSVPSAPPAPPPTSAPVPELDIEPVSAAAPSVAPTQAAPASAATVPELEFADIELPPAPGTPTASVRAAAPPAPSPVSPPALGELSFAPQATARPAPPPQSSPFVTETMAELYLQQGHRDAALHVYRALVQQRPGDPSLREKVAMLERSGPSIREVLGLVALRRPGVRPELPTHNGAPQVEAPVLAEAPRISALGPDRIGAVFGTPRISSADESAAMSLALAFVGLNGAPQHGGSTDESAAQQIAGAPARPASTELSLDSVFGGQNRAPAPSSFSFDQFFSQRATTEHSTTPDVASDARSDSKSDVAQFTQWLEGLKQR